MISAKKTYLLLLLMMAILPVVAQRATVGYLRMEPTDMSASVYKRVDNNGQPCALLKVILPLKNVLFEGNIVGTVENKGGEYWVYMTSGTKMFKIKHESFEPVMVYTADFDMNSLKGSSTYALRLNLPADTNRPSEVPEDISYNDIMDVFETMIKDGKYSECYNMARMLPDNEIALYYLGEIYSRGYGRDVDVEAAMDAYRKSSDKMHPPADFALVALYIRNGIKDFNEAAVYITRAAEEANPWACYILSRMYYYGKGVEQDDEKSEYWLEEANNNNWDGEDFSYLDFTLFRPKGNNNAIKKITR